MPRSVLLSELQAAAERGDAGKSYWHVAALMEPPGCYFVLPGYAFIRSKREAAVLRRALVRQYPGPVRTKIIETRGWP